MKRDCVKYPPLHLQPPNVVLLKDRQPSSIPMRSYSLLASLSGDGHAVDDGTGCHTRISHDFHSSVRLW